MKILIINCHWDNRGDEAAIRAMLDELRIRYPDGQFYIQRAIGDFGYFPDDTDITILPMYPETGKIQGIMAVLAYVTNGRCPKSKAGKTFYDALRGADIVLHAPGGPSIGDLYKAQETKKLLRLLMVKRSRKKYAFYAPSMGPFEDKVRNAVRRRIIEGAALVCLREEVSQKYLCNLSKKVKSYVTLDSAFQHPVDMKMMERSYEAETTLKEFIGDGNRVIGMTITDLQWNARYRNDGKTKENIENTFHRFVQKLTERGYKILFIPQLFGGSSDADYMNGFCTENCCVLETQHDCYFQQYIISRLQAVVGMRYHSNIFSAKMGTPFLSISYEQKMKGFMYKAELERFCLDIENLSYDSLIERFELMMDEYRVYRQKLMEKKEAFRKEAARTTDLVCKLLD